VEESRRFCRIISREVIFLKSTKWILTATLLSTMIVPACTSPNVSLEGASSGNSKPSSAPVPTSAPTAAPIPTPTPVPTVKPTPEPTKTPEVKPEEKPAVQQPNLSPAGGLKNPTAADMKPINWYYMKKKKGEVPGFPAEMKTLTADQKAVWVGEGKKVYLTIDVGGELLDYKKLLKALKDNDVKATFFMTGYNLKNNPDYVKLLLEEGHVIGNHTITHKDFTTLSDEAVKKEFADFEKLYTGITGKEPTKLFRFPYGTFSKHLLSLVTELGYTSYFWSTAMKDWVPRTNAEDPYNDIIGNLHDGNIILMHHASKENIDAMDRILKEIKKEGYEFGQIGDLKAK
jgi:peptidoglycan-N-acetylmuramic acid deacetylase